MRVCVTVYADGYTQTSVLIHITSYTRHPLNVTRSTNAVLMLAQRRRRWASIKTALVTRVMLTGRSLTCHIYHTSYSPTPTLLAPPCKPYPEYLAVGEITLKLALHPFILTRR